MEGGHHSQALCTRIRGSGRRSFIYFIFRLNIVVSDFDLADAIVTVTKERKQKIQIDFQKSTKIEESGLQSVLEASIISQIRCVLSRSSLCCNNLFISSY